MKYAEFTLKNNKIEFLNSVFGIESVLLNGKTVSKKFSFSGLKHKLNLDAEEFTLKSKYKQFGNREIELELLKNRESIEKQIVQISRRQRLLWILTSAGLGLAIRFIWF